MQRPFLMVKELRIMAENDEPDTSGPSAEEKAQKALGENLARPAKPPPTFPGHEVEKNEPLARRTTDEVDDL